ncbi:MAG: amidase family protein, partial [Sciscionella sp.]
EPAARAGQVGDLETIRVGVARAWLAELPSGMRDCLAAALRQLEARGATLADVELPDLDLLTATNRMIAYAEGSTHHEPLLRSTPDYGANVRPRMEAGRFLLAGEYLTAQRVRATQCAALGALWSDVDILLTPTLPCTAPVAGSMTVEVAGRALSMGTALIRYTGPFNLSGAPAINVPCGRDTDGLPIGLQLAAAPFEERLLCYVAAAAEAEIGFEYSVGEHPRAGTPVVDVGTAE